MADLESSSGSTPVEHPDVVRVRESVSTENLVEACLGHVKALPWASYVVVGVTSAAELREIKAAWDACVPKIVPIDLRSSDGVLIDPRRW